MQNDTAKERASATDSSPEEERTEPRGGSEGVGSEQANSGLLDSATQGSGTHDPEGEENGEEAIGPLGWSFGGIWNKTLAEDNERLVEARSYLWASDIGKPFIDVWLAMRGTKKTNPPNARSRRKFEAGNVWEWIVKIILLRSGILIASQDRLEHTYPGLLRVSGKVDFIAGGKPDYEKGRAGIADLMLPEKFSRVQEKIVEHFAANYPNGLDNKIIEMKSVSAFMFEALEKKRGSSLKIHRMQIYHYLKSKQIPEGEIVYICRDDCRMMEVAVYLDDPATEKEYHDWIEKMTAYSKSDEMPPKEKAIVFDEDLGKFSKNNQVAWSGYLSMIYGIKDQAEFDEKYKSPAERWNRVLGRVKKGDKMTAKNLEALEEIKAAGFDVEAIKERLVVTAEEEADHLS